jgi:hypothetical protein
MSQKRTRKLGRPALADPQSIQLNFRINRELRAALEAYLDLHRPPAEFGTKWDLSDAARHALRRSLSQDGLLAKPGAEAPDAGRSSALRRRGKSAP